MPGLKVHYDGWIALPEAFRRKLGLERGDELEAELADGTIVLRPVQGSAKAMEGVAPDAALATPTPSVLAAEPQPAEPSAAPEAPHQRRPSLLRSLSLLSLLLHRKRHRLPSVVVGRRR
jgi:AbrB family looped-hinge helix DNA binding protein